jgi:peptidoglycan hydrolase-like protein with peptidoglycan-binding domain
VRGWIIGGVATLAIAGAVTAGFVLTSGKGDEAGAAPDGTTEPPELATVEQRDLQRTESFDGTTGHGEAEPLVLAGTGTLTALPTPGDVIEPGATVVEVDGHPIIALQGPLPMWRALGPSVSDGKDVQQLEYVLTALGYGETYGVTVDEDWTSATTNAVEAFQEDHGLDDDGTIDVGDIVWIPGPLRVDGVTGAIGQQLGEAGITVTGTTQLVHVDLAVSDADVVATGTAVTVELPSGETIDATVTSIGSAETGEDGSSTLPVDITMAEGADVADGLPVDVEVTTVAADDVLVVPVNALLALAGGGYALEVSDDGGATHLARVDLGVFADDLVAVTGDIAAGDQVVVP